jgi:rare lipoprotein A
METFRRVGAGSALALGLALAGCYSPPARPPAATAPSSFSQEGMASWYGPGFHRHRTADGERFDMNALTAAHRTLPLNSVVRVTNLDNGRSVIVRINDRGPYEPGRIIDLSAKAARDLGMKEDGLAHVRIEFANEGQGQAAL